MSHEARGARPDVTVTVERLDVAAPRRGRRRRPVEGARVPRRDAVVLLAAAKRASDFANVLALHQGILAASRRTTRVYRAEAARCRRRAHGHVHGCSGIALPARG